MKSRGKSRVSEALSTLLKKFESIRARNFRLFGTKSLLLSSSRGVFARYAGVPIPVNHTDGRDVEFMMYLLWDWFDGGFTKGW